jgi:hypothetical protein
MKCLLFAAAMALPVAAAATVAMEPLQATSPSQDAVQSRQAEGQAHRQMFIVRYELRRPATDETQQIIMDDARPQIVPPPAGGHPTAILRPAQSEPNTIVCYGWGCESRQL